MSGPRTVISFDSSLDVAPVATPSPTASVAPALGRHFAVPISFARSAAGHVHPDVFQTKADDRYCSIPKWLMRDTGCIRIQAVISRTFELVIRNRRQIQICKT